MAALKPLFMIACQISRAATMNDFPLWRDHRRAMNWLLFLRNASWYVVGENRNSCLQNSMGSVGMPRRFLPAAFFLIHSMWREISRSPRRRDNFARNLLFQIFDICSKFLVFQVSYHSRADLGKVTANCEPTLLNLRGGLRVHSSLEGSSQQGGQAGEDFITFCEFQLIYFGFRFDILQEPRNETL